MRNYCSWIALLQTRKIPLEKRYELGGTDTKARNQALSWRLLRKSSSAQFVLKEQPQPTVKKSKIHIHSVRFNPRLHINGTTSRRNSPTRSSSLRSGRRPPLSAAGPSCSSVRWSWRRPGACWWGEWGLPSPGFPLRRFGSPTGSTLLPSRSNKSQRVALPAKQKFPDGTAVC